MNKNLKGVLLVAFGAFSYGLLATAVKYANSKGSETAGLAFSQYFLGAVILTLLSFNKKLNPISDLIIKTKHAKLKLLLFGTSLGATSSFYYLSIQYVPVSIAIILLMQTIWMGVALEVFRSKGKVSFQKILGASMAILGTIFAAKVFESEIVLNLFGVIYGLLAAMFFTVSIYASNTISLELPLIERTKWLVYGGLIIVIAFWNIQILESLTFITLFKWGVFLAIFGTLIPPILFNKGMPIVGTATGSVITALEIPVSVLSAYLILKEPVSQLQWLGIIIILLSTVIINIQVKKETQSTI